MIHLTTTTKIIAGAVALSLGWIVLEACDCDPANIFNYNPDAGYWVTCVGNAPTLMEYSGSQPTVVSDPPENFSPSDWDCTHPSSPHYKNSQSPAPYPTTPPSNNGSARPRATATGYPYAPVPLRDLPFTPAVPPLTTAACQSSFPDVFRTNHTENTVTRISTCPFNVKTTIPVFQNPLQVVVTPDGSMALVTSFGDLQGDGGAVTFISLASNKVTSTVMMPFQVTPNGLAISPDSTTAYIGNFTNPGQSILVMNIASQMITGTIQNVVQYPSGLTLTPDGSQLWVASPLGAEVDVIDTLSETEIYRLNIQSTTDIAFNSTGTTAYITSAASSPGQVIAVNTATFQTVNTYTVGASPSDISMSYGDRFLVVNNDIDGTISVIDLKQNAVKTLPVGTSPSGIAFLQ